MAAPHHSNPLDHVVDSSTLELPWGLVRLGKIPLGFTELQVTRFMVMEAIAAALMLLILIPLARHVARRPVTRGAFFNAFEAILLYFRDSVARPTIGGHGADDFLPYLWTVFFFVLFNNLLGMIPGGASATGNLNVTLVLAVSTFVVVMIAGIRASGVGGFWTSLVPTIELPPSLAFFNYLLWPLLFVIEVAGLVIRHFVLAVRLFANMLAGHIVLAVILGFILMVEGSKMAYVVTPASVGGVVALSMLELFVAFLQAYIFTFLSALFIGSAAHPH
jgi:F-type H+-transporting ATPase subunit a